MYPDGVHSLPIDRIEPKNDWGSPRSAALLLFNLKSIASVSSRRPGIFRV